MLDLGDRLLTQELGLPWEPGRALIPFPPLPAVILLPFVAVWGLATQGALVFAVLGGVNVGLCFRMLTRVTPRRDAAFLGTVVYGFGTVAWYASMLGTHLVPGPCRGEHAAVPGHHRGARRGASRGRGWCRTGPARAHPTPGHRCGPPVRAGLPRTAHDPVRGAVLRVRGPRRDVAPTCRGRRHRRALPLLLLVGYNLATTGHVFHPAYDHLREIEYRPVPELYHEDWGTEDPRYILVNAPILLARPPINATDDGTPCEPTTDLPDQLLNTASPCPLRPDPVGMSILLTTPAYLLAIPAIWFGWRRRLVAGAAIAVLGIVLADLAHFSQGWVQFGYRFSNDFAPFAMILVALGIAEAGRSRVGWLLAWSLVIASVVVNAWGVMWGVALRW